MPFVGGKGCAAAAAAAGWDGGFQLAEESLELGVVEIGVGGGVDILEGRGDDLVAVGGSRGEIVRVEVEVLDEIGSGGEAGREEAGVVKGDAVDCLGGGRVSNASSF